MRTAGPNVYHHYKGGYYRVLFGALFSFATDGHGSAVTAKMLDGGRCIVYVSMTNGHVFVRPYNEFHEVFTVNDPQAPKYGQLVTRFVRVPEEEVIG